MVVKKMVGAVCQDLLRDIILWIPLKNLKEFSNVSPVIFREIALAGIRVLSLGKRIIDLRGNVTVIRGNGMIDVLRYVDGKVCYSLVTKNTIDISKIVTDGSLMYGKKITVHISNSEYSSIRYALPRNKSWESCINTTQRYREKVYNIDPTNLLYVMSARFEKDFCVSYVGFYHVIFKDSCWISCADC